MRHYFHEQFIIVLLTTYLSMVCCFEKKLMNKFLQKASFSKLDIVDPSIHKNPIQNKIYLGVFRLASSKTINSNKTMSPSVEHCLLNWRAEDEYLESYLKEKFLMTKSKPCYIVNFPTDQDYPNLSIKQEVYFVQFKESQKQLQILESYTINGVNILNKFIM